jgi:LuxR family maltose regulon positive regulatory protein
VLEIELLQALAAAGQGQATDALAALERALAFAAPEGYVRLFVDKGASMAALLHEAYRHGIAREYVARLLDAFPDSGVPIVDFGLHSQPPIQHSNATIQNLPEPLTARELEVLRLLAAGASNNTIAETLVISLGTVKKHVNNLFGKLQVQNRTQAVVRARELQLI